VSESRFDALDRKAMDIYGSARSDGLLKFCQEVVAVCAEGRRLERALCGTSDDLEQVRLNIADTLARVAAVAPPEEQP
jgi:hypothetical protein